jgi:hypothetical protein
MLLFLFLLSFPIIFIMVDVMLNVIGITIKYY